MLRESRLEIVFRPHQQPTFTAPLMVRSAGDYSVFSPYSESSGKKWFTELFWVVEGRGSFHIGSECVDVSSGQAFLYFPGEPHRIAASTDRWRFLWLTLDGPATAEVLSGFGLKERLYQANPPPESLFREVINGLREATPYGEVTASRAAYAILAELAWTRRRMAAPTDLAERLRTLIDRHFCEPETTVEALADRLGVHRSTAFRAFRRGHGLSPSVYLQSRRLQKGLSLLQQTSMSVHEIALAVGFTDPNHFAKAIRRATGESPSAFRSRTDLLERRHRIY